MSVPLPYPTDGRWYAYLTSKGLQKTGGTCPCCTLNTGTRSAFLTFQMLKTAYLHRRKRPF